MLVKGEIDQVAEDERMSQAHGEPRCGPNKLCT